MTNNAGNGSSLPLDPNGAPPFNMTDQTTRPEPSYFLKSISNFSLASDSPKSTVETIERGFTAASGHGIIGDVPGPSSEILLLDPVGDRSLYSQRNAVATDNITVDRPIDHVFPAASTLGRIVSSQMSVNGSTTPQIFSIRAGAVPTDNILFSLFIESASEPDFSKFGNQAALANGISFRVVDGFQKTIWNFKTLGEMESFGFNVKIQQKSGGGTWGTTCKILMNEALGVATRLDGTDVAQWVVQDEITQTSMRAAVGSHRTQGEA